MRSSHLPPAPSQAGPAHSPDEASSSLHARQSAESLVRNYGRQAEAEAYRMARRCAARGDKEGEALWLAIVSTLQTMPGARPLRVLLKIPA